MLDTKLKYGLNKYARLNAENCCFVANLNKSFEPTSYEEASKNVNWISAMNDEVFALHENNTWEEVC